MSGATLQAGWAGSLEALSSGKERWGCKKVVWRTNGFIVATQHGLYTMGWQSRDMYLNNVYPRLTSSLAGLRDHHMETQGCRLARTEPKVCEAGCFRGVQKFRKSCICFLSERGACGSPVAIVPRNMPNCCTCCLVPHCRRYQSIWL